MQSVATDQPALRRDWAAPGAFALLLAAMIFLPFWDVLLGFKTFVVRDFTLYSYPAASFQRECFWRGQLPFWNPYNCCGLPFLAQLNTLSLYPLSLLYLLLPLSWALPAFCLLHLFLGGMGAYFLARYWTGAPLAGAVAGVIYAFNGLALNFLMWPSHVATFAWLPWVVWLTSRAWRAGGRSLVPAALAGAMEILGGGPETILITWLLLTGLAVIEACQTPPNAGKIIRRFLLAGALSFALAAPQLLPFAELVWNGNRTAGFAKADWSMPPYGWGNFLVPLFKTSWHGAAGQYWTSSYYAGIGTVFLAGVALWRRRAGRVVFLGVLLFVSLILALGDFGLLFPWLKRAAPFLGMFRYPVKFVIVAVAVLPFLAAEGVACLSETRTARRFEAGWAFALFASVALLVVVAWQWPARPSLWATIAVNALWRGLFFAAILGALWLLAARPSWRGWSIVLLAGLFWGDLLTHRPWQNPTVAPFVLARNLGRNGAGLATIPTLATSRLMMSPYAADRLYYQGLGDETTNCVLNRIDFFADCNLLDDMPKVDGFFSLNLRRTDRVLRLLEPATGAQLNRLEDFLSVSETIAPSKVFDWMARTNFIPVATIGQEPHFADENTAFAAIVADSETARRVVYLPLAAQAKITARAQKEAHIVSTDFGLSRQSIRVRASGPAMLVLNEAYYPNWRARVDGRPATLWLANAAFEAVEVPAGEHEVTLRYEDSAFDAGLAIAALGAIICLSKWLCGGKVS